jgi:hypothetical protein
MKFFLTILLALAIIGGSPVAAQPTPTPTPFPTATPMPTATPIPTPQPLKALMFTTNGQVVAATNVVWTNSFNFSTNTVAAQVRTNLGLGATWLTNTNAANFRTDIGLGSSDVASFGGVRLDMSNTITWGTGNSTIYSVLNTQPQINFATLGVIRATLGDGRLTLANGTVLQFDGMPNGPTAAATTRTNLGLGAAWLTNSTAPLFWTSVPSTPTSSGTAGQIAYTNNFLYICISNNTWRRVQLGTW